MKKIILTVLIAVFVLFAEPRIHGFFIQPSLSYGGIDYMNTYFATQEHFDMWVQSMADVSPVDRVLVPCIKSFTYHFGNLSHATLL